MTLASVVIPCHDKEATLPLTVATVLRQSVSDLEVLLLGDGVTDAVRAVIAELVAGDDRVRFLDLPKGPHHGEAYRHDAVMAARSEAILYLCDDDLLLPEHVADLLSLLERATLVQSLNGYLRTDGAVRLYAADLAEPACIAPILDDRLVFNSVSITGTAHRRSFYLEAGEHWETTPAGVWPDHHQWRRMMRHPSFRGATSQRMTALQLPTTQGGRDRWTQAERLAELRRWYDVVVAPDGQAQIDEAVRLGALRQLSRLRPQAVRLRADLRDSLADAAAASARVEEQEVQGRRLRRQRDRARGEVERLQASRSWRLTAPLRRASRWLPPR